MVCLGHEPGAAGWEAHMNPLSYGGTPTFYIDHRYTLLCLTVWLSVIVSITLSNICFYFSWKIVSL